LLRTVINGVKIENNIGDAIVHRIIKAHRDSTPWKCCIVIPLLPGFTFPVDHSDASAVRPLFLLMCLEPAFEKPTDSHHPGMPEPNHCSGTKFYFFTIEKGGYRCVYFGINRNQPLLDD
jgi:hypothetical protein